MRELYYGDCLDVLQTHVSEASVDLIYLDPPFYSNRVYRFSSRQGEAQSQVEVFRDVWVWHVDDKDILDAWISQRGSVGTMLKSLWTMLGESGLLAYLLYMTRRLVACHRVLKGTGSVYLHCDPTVSHYLKIVLDHIFGKENFRNEIVWAYNTGGVSKRHFARKHDILLFYSKSDQYTFHMQKQKSYVKTLPEPHTDSGKRLGIQRDVYGKYRYVHARDFWNDIDALFRNDVQRVGYPTQKPHDLLKRIIKVSSNAGDIILDPFCGCGTTVCVAEELDRRWLGIDASYLAVDLTRRRLMAIKGVDEHVFGVKGIPDDIISAESLLDHTRRVEDSNQGRRHYAGRFEFQRWAVSLVGGLPCDREVGEQGIDGYIAFYGGDNDYFHCAIQVALGEIDLDEVHALRETVMHDKDFIAGILITLKHTHTNMIQTLCDQVGDWLYPPENKRYPRLQVWSIADHFAGYTPILPRHKVD